MGQPTPPGDIPLYDGLGAEWNDIVGAFPEDKRGELAPVLKSKIDAYEPLKGYEEFHKSGITPEHVGNALNLYKIIEDNPRQVYDVIAKHLNITPQQAQQVVEEAESPEESQAEDPRVKTLQDQVAVLSQIALANHNQTLEQQQAAAMDAAIEEEINAVKKKYGNDVNEEELILRMIAKNISAEQAHHEVMALADQFRRRPAPFVMGNGGVVPRNNIDVKKLDTKDTRNLVAQMMQNAILEDNK